MREKKKNSVRYEREAEWLMSLVARAGHTSGRIAEFNCANSPHCAGHGFQEDPLDEVPIDHPQSGVHPLVVSARHPDKSMDEVHHLSTAADENTLQSTWQQISYTRSNSIPAHTHTHSQPRNQRKIDHSSPCSHSLALSHTPALLKHSNPNKRAENSLDRLKRAAPALSREENPRTGGRRGYIRIDEGTRLASPWFFQRPPPHRCCCSIQPPCPPPAAMRAPSSVYEPPPPPRVVRWCTRAEGCCTRMYCTCVCVCVCMCVCVCVCVCMRG